MKKRIASLILCASLLLTGCSERETEYKEIEDLTAAGIVSSQTASTGINSNKEDFISLLISGNYYVVSDGIYYPLVSYMSNCSGTPGTTVDNTRQMYFTTENEIEIPTLFAGDELVYYSADSLLDYIVWERFYDLGYTIGLLNLQTMQSGRVYANLAKDTNNIIPDSELFDMYNLGVENVLIDKVGGVRIDGTFLSDGLISSMKKSKAYDLEIYTGTQFKHYTTTANTHVFKSFEIFASVEYEPLQEFLYRVEIPEYFIDGYYTINGQMFRYVTSDKYSEDTDFNKQLLFPPVNEYASDEYVAPGRYSTFEPLNQFSTNIEGALGYVEKDEEALAQQKRDELFKEAIVKKIELWFPENTKCSISITSPTKEATGDIKVSFESGVKFLNYDRLNQVYEANFDGKGEKGTLIISGFADKYNIKLTNCTQYAGQDDSQKNPIDSEQSKTVNSESESTATENKRK